MLPLLAGLLPACIDDGVVLPEPVFDIENTGAYAQPWPGDQHLDADGTLSFTAFRRPAGIPLIESYIELGEQQIGWGTNSPIYLRVEGELALDRMPTPAESMEDGSSIVLVDIDPDSPHLGERVPIVWRASGEVTAYQPEGLLAVAPAPGFPLLGDTRYALLLLDSGFSVNPAFQDVFDDDHPHHPLWADVPPLLRDAGIRRRSIAGGVIYTTSDPTAELARIARFVQADLPPPDLDLQLDAVESFESFTVYEGRYPSPVFTHGERPYTLEGGGFRFDADGVPEIASWDDMRLAVCVPNDAEMPETGWPVVLYQHGTGGDYRTPCDSASTLEPGAVAARAGFVVLGIDQPLHGPRNGGQPTSDLANFNILNPVSGRSNFRQGAADALYLARGLANRPTTLLLPDGQRIRLDPDAVTFLGHSQGGLTGALASPFWAGDVQAAVLSGAGGLLAITIVDRKDILDFADLVAGVARFQPDEEVHELHPALGVVQMLVEPTDPINYAPHWFREPLAFPGRTPTPVLATSGTLDANTPYRGAIAMAGAAGLPPLPPRATGLPPMELRGIGNAVMPASENAGGWEGPVTAGFSQWYEGSHFVIFQEPRAAQLYQTFLETAVTATPVLDLPPDPDQRP